MGVQFVQSPSGGRLIAYVSQHNMYNVFLDTVTTRLPRIMAVWNEAQGARSFVSRFRMCIVQKLSSFQAP